MIKKLFSFSLLLMISSSLFAQSAMDSIFTNKEVLLVEVMEITPDVVKYVYPGEKVINSLHKNAVEKITFKSGRTQIFREKLATKAIKGPQDWKNVSISRIEYEVRGLYKIGEVFSKAKGTTALSNMNRVKDRAFKKLKIQATMMGANIIYLTNQDVEGNRFFDDSSNPTETNLSGVAYSSELPDFEEFKSLIGDKQTLTYSQKLYLGNNSTDVQISLSRDIQSTIG